MDSITINPEIYKIVTYIPILLISFALHEFAHAYSANYLGDPTPKRDGRLTLNPIKHLELVGSVIVPLFSMIGGGFIIGWAKPVRVTPGYFKKPLRDDAIVSGMGPVSNLLLAIVFSVILALMIQLKIGTQSAWLLDTIVFGISFNVFLFLFNLLPIPPLDGSHILYSLFPNEITAKIRSMGMYGTIILMLLIFSPLWGLFLNLHRIITHGLLGLTH